MLTYKTVPNWHSQKVRPVWFRFIIDPPCHCACFLFCLLAKERVTERRRPSLIALCVALSQRSPEFISLIYVGVPTYLIAAVAPATVPSLDRDRGFRVLLPPVSHCSSA